MRTPTDHSKKRWYVITDLVIKSVSSIALVVIGYAGWKLQSSADERRALIEGQELRARQYLPPLQTLAELQVSLAPLVSQSKQFDVRIRDRDKLEREAWRLAFLANSMQFPTDVPSEVRITALEHYARLDAPRGALSMGLREATSLAAEVLMAQPLIYENCIRRHGRERLFTKVRFSSKPPILYFSQAPDTPLPGDAYIVLEPSNAPAWSKWFPVGGMDASTLCETGIQLLLKELANAAGSITASILAKHGEVAEKAVALRVDALRAGSEASERKPVAK